MMISIQTEDFSPAEAYDWLASQPTSTNQHGIGGIVTFTGLVRDMNLGDTVGGLFLEHYAGMTEKALQVIIDEAHTRWNITAVRIIHRVGQLYPGDRIVFVGVAGAHRKEAFEACQFVMDYLKTKAPFWKKETTTTGQRWVEERASDIDAAKRW